MVTPTELGRALQLLTGDPELVVVDARVLRLLMGDLAPLIILGPVPGIAGLEAALADREMFSDDGPFAWDGDEFPCTEN